MRLLFIFVGAIEARVGVIGFVVEVTDSSIDKILGYSLAITLFVAGILTFVGASVGMAGAGELLSEVSASSLHLERLLPMLMLT